MKNIPMETIPYLGKKLAFKQVTERPMANIMQKSYNFNEQKYSDDSTKGKYVTNNYNHLQFLRSGDQSGQYQGPSPVRRQVYIRTFQKKIAVYVIARSK